MATGASFIVESAHEPSSHSVSIARVSAPASPVWLKTSSLHGREIVDTVVAVGPSPSPQLVASIHKPLRGWGVAIRLVGWPEGVYTSLRPTQRGSARHFAFAIEDEPTPAPEPDGQPTPTVSRMARAPSKRRRMFTIRPFDRSRSMLSLANLSAMLGVDDQSFAIHDAAGVELLRYVDTSRAFSTNTRGAITVDELALRRPSAEMPLELLLTVALAIVDVIVDAEAYRAAQQDIQE